jgi:hypothetical protein
MRSILVNGVNEVTVSQRPAEGLVQQAFPQLLQRRQLPLVERREALGFG